VIGEQPFYKLPNFDKFVLAQIYDQVPSGECEKPIPFLKVKSIASGNLEVVLSGHLVWS